MMSRPVKILTTRHFDRDFKKLTTTIQKRVTEILGGLSESPYGFELLSGQFRGLRRIRIGDYRAIYKIEEGKDHTVVLLLFIAHRKSVYE